MRRGRTALRRFCLLLGLLFCLPALAQNNISVENQSILPGDSFQTSVLFDNVDPIMGFSFGLRHDATRLTPTLVEQGADVLARNAGAGADYFYVELNALNGPGLYVACLFTFSGPLDEMPAGIDNEAAVVTYSSNAASPPASTTAITPASDLGDPPVLSVFSVNGTSFFPSLTDGTVTFLVPPPTGATCTLIDPCTCAFGVSWSNGASYSAIQVRVDGLLVATLSGGLTSTTVTLPSTGTSQVCVRGVVGGTSSVDACCTADCPPVVPAPPPSNLTCSTSAFDPLAGCTVDVNWTLGGVYSSIDVLVGGALATTVGGAATSASVTVPTGGGTTQICVVASDECGAPLAAVCCDVTCELPPPSATTCTLTDPCSCEFAISWTNGAAYTAVEVRLDGTLLQTLAGTATSTTVTLPAPGTGQVCVRGVAGGASSVDDCCTADCPMITPAPLPSVLSCSITSSDPVLGCSVDVSWTPQGIYSSFDISLGGIVVATLPGTATSTTLTLPSDPTAQLVCLTATDECGAPIAGLVCCDVTCQTGTLFVRGDCNADNSLDIGDAIQVLNVLFAGAGPALCTDACDVNDDGGFDISDAISLLANLFSGGAPPPPPHPGCGIDPTDDPLDCQSFPGC